MTIEFDRFNLFRYVFSDQLSWWIQLSRTKFNLSKWWHMYCFEYLSSLLRHHHNPLPSFFFYQFISAHLLGLVPFVRHRFVLQHVKMVVIVLLPIHVHVISIYGVVLFVKTQFVVHLVTMGEPAVHPTLVHAHHNGQIRLVRRLFVVRHVWMVVHVQLQIHVRVHPNGQVLIVVLVCFFF